MFAYYIISLTSILLFENSTMIIDVLKTPCKTGRVRMEAQQPDANLYNSCFSEVKRIFWLSNILLILVQ